MQQILTMKQRESRVCQGDVLRDVRWVEYVAESNGEIEVCRIEFPLAIVLTQDCDLEQDYSARTQKEVQQKPVHEQTVEPQKADQMREMPKPGTKANTKDYPKTQDKWLISVLMAPIYNVEHVYAGAHLIELGRRMEPVPKNGNSGNFLRNNERPRYHFLQFEDDVPIPPSVIDFKHYFSVTIEYLNSVKPSAYVCSVAPIFREDIAQRFAAFLGRIGLPDNINEAGSMREQPGQSKPELFVNATTAP